MDTRTLELPVVRAHRPVHRPARRPNPVVLIATLGYTGVIAWITLSSASTGSAVRSTSTWVIRMLERLPVGVTGEQWEFLLNIAMFVPLGVLLVLLFGPRFFWLAALGAIALSLSVEGLQQLIPFRVPDTRDLVANGLGGIAGMFLGIAISVIGRRR